MDAEKIKTAANAPDQIAARAALARYTADSFKAVGMELHVVGHFIGEDRAGRISPFGHGDDSTVAVSMLLRLGSQLVSGAADLLLDGRHYAGAALVRQLVEVEYLAWAFEDDNDIAAAWLRSSRDERKSFFTPAKLRSRAGGRFRSVDYGFHCEIGGHPVPGSWMLLRADTVVAQLMLSDSLGHTGRIWDHVVGWARARRNGDAILKRAAEMSERYGHWKDVDELTSLGPPPDFPATW